MEFKNNLPVIDWDPSHQWGPSEIECACGRIYKSHSKLVKHDGRLIHFTEVACPNCGRSHDHVVRASSEPEQWSL